MHAGVSNRTAVNQMTKGNNQHVKNEDKAARIS